MHAEHIACGEQRLGRDIDGANAALDHLATATRDGQIRAFTANEYLDRLISGEFIASMGWSGDLAQVAREHPNLRFVVPEEGAMLWFDTMMIPKGSPHVRAAASFMDSVYDVETAATITEYVQYISPVSGVQDAVASRGPEGEALDRRGDGAVAPQHHEDVFSIAREREGHTVGKEGGDRATRHGTSTDAPA